MRSIVRLVAFPLGALALAACGEDADPHADGIPADAPDLAATTSTCVTLDPGERVLSASPEGDLWAFDEAAETLRVIQPDGGSTPVPFSIDGPARLQAWSATRATLRTGAGALWTLDAVEETMARVRLPSGAGAAVGFCGDPARDGDGFVLADALLERSAGQWWRWTPASAGSLGPPRLLGHGGGGCRPLGGDVWAGTDHGLWRLDTIRAERFPDLVDLARIATGGPRGPAVLGADGSVLLGTDGGLAPLAVEAGPARAVDAAGGWLWVAAGGEVFGLGDGAGWRRLAPTGAAIGRGEVAGVWAHGAGGVWTLDGRALCHHALGPLLRVRGVRADEVRAEATADLLVQSDLSEGDVSVRLDDAQVAVGALVDGRFAVPALALGARGVHRLEVELTHAGGRIARTLPFDLHPLTGGTWAADVLPVFETHCAGGPCHGPDPSSGDRPDLSTFEGWVANAATIRQRVGVVADMPPPDLRSRDWGPDQVEAIVGWIDGGMERGE